MKDVTRLAFVDPSDVTRASLKTLLLGIESVWLEAECSRYEFFADVMEQSQPDIGIVALDADPERAVAVISEVRRSLPTCDLFAVSSSQEGGLILRAMRAGACEFLAYPLVLEEFLNALDRVRKSSGGDGEGGPSAKRVISFAGVSGGIGCTSLAVNLACCLATQPKASVAAIDLDIALGDADVWLDIIPEYTIQDVAENITRLDYSLLKRSLTKHDCGAFLLPRPIHLDATSPITPDSLRRVTALMKATFSHLVFDLSKSFGPLDLAAMELSDDVLLITQLDLAALRNVVRTTQFLDQHDNIRDKVKIVVNRQGLGDTAISLSKALETIGREVFWQVPNDYATMVESRNNGVPLVVDSPKAKVTKSLMDLSIELGGFKAAPAPEVEAEKKQSKRLFSFLSSAGK